MGTVEFEVAEPADIGTVATWSVSEAATQASPMDQIRTTPSFSVTAFTTPDTRYAAMEKATIEHPLLGILEGDVTTVTEVGPQATIEAHTPLSLLNRNVDYPDTRMDDEEMLSDYVERLVMGVIGR